MSERLSLTEKLTKVIKKSPAIRGLLIKYFGTQILQFFGRKNNIRVRSSADYFDLSHEKQTVRINKSHFLYGFDIINYQFWQTIGRLFNAALSRRYWV
jgi:hypothetical protein